MYAVNDVLSSTVHRIMCMLRVYSVNGFICFWSDDACLHVCNAITKEYFTTPPYSYNTNMAQHRLVAVGFGFCRLSYEYKVVVLHEHTEFEYADIKPIILTVGTDRSWRSLKVIPDTKFISRIESGAHVKGVLYWYLESCTLKDWPCHSKRIERLICFDVTKEEFDMIIVPAEIDGVGGVQNVISITEKGGNLCLINISHGPIFSILI
ncbi:putative F-box protein [Capsicum chacoense]|uniref:putative F-box protein At3g21120 n=1 Tax=Capsicum annuum TaxID=4072 RepID=UPI001FB10D7E|nr:putative F-box protein At3g21120 [Capsicum annuum]XP_047270112.1 putative F-box protein At3g21120 [Capsicum annuum]